MTGIVDLTRDQAGRTRARLKDRGDAFRAQVSIATLDPFHGYKNAIDNHLDDAVAVGNAFHIVKLGGQMVDDVRRRVQQAIHGHRGRKDDPLYGIRNVLHCAEERLTNRQYDPLATAIDADERHVEVMVDGGVPNSSGPSTTSRMLSPGDGSLSRSSRVSRPARAPRSPVSAGP